MNLSTGDQAQVIGVGAAVLLAAGAGAFKTASLRGDMNAKWARRVALAVSALDEKLISGLEQLRDEVDELLPADRFSPADAIADPAPLAQHAEETVAYHRARVRMEGDLKLLRNVGPVFVFALAVLGLAAAGLTAYVGELLLWAWLPRAGLISGGVAFLVLIVALAAYAVLNHRLASAEILAGTGGQLESEGES